MGHVIQPKLLVPSLKMPVPLLPSQSVAPQELALAQIKLRKTSTLLPPPSPEPPLTPEDHVIQPKLLVPSLKHKMPVPQLPSQSDAPQELALAQIKLRKPSTLLPPPSPEPPLTTEDHLIQPKLLVPSLKVPVPLLPSQSDAPQELALAQIKLRKTSTLLPPPSPEP